MPEQSKGAAYQAFLGFYNGQLKAMGLDKQGLVQQAANFAYSIGGCSQPFSNMTLHRSQCCLLHQRCSLLGADWETAPT